MIASIKAIEPESQQADWHADFLAMLPAIRRQARISFRSVPPEARDELIQEVVANCLVAYRRLVQLGKHDIAYPSALARFAVKQVRSGRRVGGRLAARDVLSEHGLFKRHRVSRSGPSRSGAKRSGRRSLSKTAAPGRPRLQRAGSISRRGSSRCHGGNGQIALRLAKGEIDERCRETFWRDGGQDFATAVVAAGELGSVSGAAVGGRVMVRWKGPPRNWPWWAWCWTAFFIPAQSNARSHQRPIPRRAVDPTRRALARAALRPFRKGYYSVHLINAGGQDFGKGHSARTPVRLRRTEPPSIR